MSWQYQSRTMTPIAVMSEFARTGFAEPRQVDEETVGGKWENGKGSRFVGSFRLIDGIRTYRLTGNPEGNWTVEVE